MIYHVSGHVQKSGDGSQRRPFRTIQEAADVATAGDIVLVAPGVYREWVNPVNSGKENAPIRYISEKKNEAVITGSERITGWLLQNEVWTVRIPNHFFGEENPYCKEVEGDWFRSKVPAHTGEVFLNGRALYEVFSPEQVQYPQRDFSSWTPADTTFVWYTTQDKETDETVFLMNCGGHDPNTEIVEITLRSKCFFPEKKHVDYITLSGFRIRQAATQWAPPTAFQEGAVGPHWAKGWIIEDCEISDSKCSGISLGKYYMPGNDNKWSHWRMKDGTQTQREVICRAVNEGWSKESIGSHIVRRCNIHDCGQTGIVGHLGCAFSIIEENHIHHIGVRQNLAGAEIAGIKFHAAIDTQIRGNRIDHCTRGIWLDWQAQGTRVSANLFHDNVPPKDTELKQVMCLGEDLFIEVSHGPTLVDHNLLLSDIACRLSAQGIAFVHNFIAGSFSFVGGGTDNSTVVLPSPRYTPYHEPHSTKIAGFMTILHGDLRFVNNVFVQKPVRRDLLAYTEEIGQKGYGAYNFVCGTGAFEDYPLPEEYERSFQGTQNVWDDERDRYYHHLPVFYSGNIYCNHATISSRDEDGIDLGSGEVTWELSHQGMQLLFLTNLPEHYRLWQEKNMQVTGAESVNTDTLGIAFEPEQLFENPDGSSIDFREDYQRQRRENLILPGPFLRLSEHTVVFDLEQIQKEYEQQRQRLEQEIMDAEEMDRIARITSDRVEVTTAETESDSWDEALFDTDRMHKEEQDTQNQDTYKEIQEALQKQPLQVNLALTGCDRICMVENGKEYYVQNIFLKENTAWIQLIGENALFELDCKYGICNFHYFDGEIEAASTADVRQAAGGYAICACVTGLLEIQRKRSARNPKELCSMLNEKSTMVLQKDGITPRFTPEYLKFIYDKKFISVEEAAKMTCAHVMELVAEVVNDK